MLCVIWVGEGRCACERQRPTRVLQRCGVDDAIGGVRRAKHGVANEGRRRRRKGQRACCQINHCAGRGVACEHINKGEPTRHGNHVAGYSDVAFKCDWIARICRNIAAGFDHVQGLLHALICVLHQRCVNACGCCQVRDVLLPTAVWIAWRIDGFSDDAVGSDRDGRKGRRAAICREGHGGSDGAIAIGADIVGRTRGGRSDDVTGGGGALVHVLDESQLGQTLIAVFNDQLCASWCDDAIRDKGLPATQIIGDDWCDCLAGSAGHADRRACEGLLAARCRESGGGKRAGAAYGRDIKARASWGRGKRIAKRRRAGVDGFDNAQIDFGYRGHRHIDAAEQRAGAGIDPRTA